MTASLPALEIEPLFLPGQAGRVFALYIGPRAAARGAVLYLPSFAEEMNRCRSTVALQARQLAALGHACLLLDYHGTGDSEGDFDAARWSTWCADALMAADWLRKRSGHAPVLWGLRLGALLAAEVASQSAGALNRLLFWQPVADGKTFLTQYLRLRVASLMDRGLPAETTESIRTQLRSGDGVEISGYRLPGGLSGDIDSKKMLDIEHFGGMQIDWFENVDQPDKPLSIGAQRVVDGIVGKSGVVKVHTFCDPAIWSLHSRDNAPDLVAKTTALFAEAA